ncbi:hypothetical protein HMPREF1502_4953 [Klebsiella sp. AS10]|uniref:hypothetical protein n=1 Tax=Klebsiella sp. AS10 TaxID=936564 RepID=UPI000449459C|nr:hypothetical protein [Klebsiella sp. AS10]EUB33288.1 hypothetical protein HMPREF1502_2642 [Klebsiella sp. AS10]EUB41296.1 hypothetical protein HMPREF1502_4953 [Klebsiella sp. AS10]
MIYMKGDYSSSDERYGESQAGCFAFIEKTIQDGDIFVSTIGVYADKEKEEEVFTFNVGTISEGSADIFSAASETYLGGFTVVGE